MTAIPAPDPVEAIANAILYEGYVLWPYRGSAMKNRQRWPFGAIYPHGFCAATRQGDAAELRCESLVEGGPGAEVGIELRCLHAVQRQVLVDVAGAFQPVAELRLDGTRHVSWEEAAERRAPSPEIAIGRLATTPYIFPVRFPAGGGEEPIVDGEGRRAGIFRRRWAELSGLVELSALRLRDALYRLRVVVRNTSPWQGDERAEAQRRAFMSTHLALGVRRGAFVSQTDPPPHLAEEAASCRSRELWPALVGEPGRRDLLLASPIILEDYPRIAPESPGDLFDGGEIDQLLTLNILAMTDEEKAEMRGTDRRAREILERTERLGRDELMSLHGTFRDPRGAA